MNTRRIVSLTSLLSFIVTVLTSVVLYIIPYGQVAYWNNWTLAGLTKNQWVDLHVNVGFLFLAVLIFHLFINWRKITTYLTSRNREFKLFTKEFNTSLLITTLFMAGTYLEIPPFSSIIQFSKAIKTSSAKTYGMPPYGHAEFSSLKKFSQMTNQNLKQGILNLRQAGFKINGPQQKLKTIADANGISPRQVAQIMNPQIDDRKKLKINHETLIKPTERSKK